MASCKPRGRGREPALSRAIRTSRRANFLADVAGGGAAEEEEGVVVGFVAAAVEEAELVAAAARLVARGPFSWGCGSGVACCHGVPRRTRPGVEMMAYG